MEQSFGKFLMFRNRLDKVYRHIGKQANRQNITCFRVYDHDLPEFPLLIEAYETKIYVAEYKRNHNLSAEQHDQWLTECIKIISEILKVEPENIYLKLRKRKEGRIGQYQKLNEEKRELIVNENGLKFIVNLSDYLDTGLFLDHRITRQMLREMADNKKVLNLFCYTGSFSVYAAAGKASQIVSVDLSKTYLEWAGRNMALNFPDYKSHNLIHADAKVYLNEAVSESFDSIVMDPPTFSNSKRMEDFLDIQKDHVILINNCIRLLKKGGELIFSTNYTKFQLDTNKIKASAIKDITKATTPFDFAGKLNRQCYKIFK